MIKKNKITHKERLPLSHDYVFKRVFAKEGNEDLLKDLLESILEIKIKKVKVLNPELVVDTKKGKRGILDLKVEVNGDILVDLEMQNKNEQNMNERSAFYISRMYSIQEGRSKDYTDYKKCIAINILNYNYLKRNSYHSVSHMRFDDTKEENYIDMGYKQEDEIYTDKFETHIIEIPKFRMKNLGVKNKKDQWLWLFEGSENMVETARTKRRIMNKAVEVIDELSMDEREREIYESLLRYEMDKTSLMNKERRERTN